MCRHWCGRPYDPWVALAIIILLIGLPIGLFMLLKPRALWWTFQSWRYKNPEANEPSDAAYAMSAFSGLIVIVAVVIVAVVAWTRPDPADRRASTASSRPSTSSSYTPKPRPAPPQNRGVIPIVAYELMDGRSDRFKGKTYLNVSYLVPKDGATAGGMNTEPRDGCEVMQTVSGLGTDRVTVDLHLSWVDRYGYAKPGADEKCRVGNWSPWVSTMVVTEVRPGTTAVTNGPIVDKTARVLEPAAPGNAVPNLYCTLDGCRVP